MMLTNTNQLGVEQLEDLKQLGVVCKEVDNSNPNFYTHILEQPRIFPASFLYYEKEQLIGFLAIYFFYEYAVEVSLLIHPQYRKKGIAKKLIYSALPLIQSQGYEKLIFSSPAQLNNTWLPEKGFTYLHSEYYMERHDLNPLLDTRSPLTFRRARKKNIPQLCIIDEACFKKESAHSAERFDHLFQGKKYYIVLAYQGNHLVGKAHFRWQPNGATLSDIAILPEKQGKGLGTSLITYCINLALKEGKPIVNLDVETHNKRALELYIKLGFLTKNACDYWSIEINQLGPILPELLSK